MKPSKEDFVIVAQEVHFAKALAGNDRFLRERALRRLGKWLTNHSEKGTNFTEEGLMRLWKGLFYCVWMSDKPLIQEDTVEAISNLISCFHKPEDSLMFIRCFYQSMSQTWFGLDQHRLDKYMMLVRRFLRHSFFMLKQTNWNATWCTNFCSDFLQALTLAPLGLVLHWTDIYLEELAKAGGEGLPQETVLKFIKPWAEYLCQQSDQRILNAVKKNIFLYLIRQTEAGIKHQLKFNSWRSMGFVGGDINCLQEVSADEEEEVDELEEEAVKESQLDPRAGHVDVELPPLEFSTEALSELLLSLRFLPSTTTQGRKALNNLSSKLTQLSSGKYPLGIKKVTIINEDDEFRDINRYARKLDDFEERIFEMSDINGKHKKRRIEPQVDEMKVKRRCHSLSWQVTTQPASHSQPTTPSSTLNSSWIVAECQEEASQAGEDSPSRPEAPTNTTLTNGVTLTPKHTPNKKKNTPGSKGKKIMAAQGNFTTDEEKPEGQSEPQANSPNPPTQTNGEVTIIIRQPQPTPDTNKPTPVPIKNRKSIIGTSTGSGKKVAFVLSRNTAQEAEEYVKSVESSPSIPYDAEKKPGQGVLKPTNVISPINPFYRRSLKKLLKF